MKKKILSFLLVITMLTATPLSVFAEDTIDKGLDTTSEINIEKNTNIIDSDEGSISEEDLDTNKKEIFEPTSPPEEETEEETKVDSQEPEGIPSEDSTESSNNEGTPNENKPIEETPVESEPVEGDTEGIVEETVEGQPIEEQPIVEQPIVEQPIVEQPANTLPVEPQIFFVSEGLTLTRAADVLTLQGYYPCENTMGVNVKLVAIQVIPLNDWVLVGSEVDFKNSKEGLKECRLTVNGQVIDNTFENGVALIEDQVEVSTGSAINIPVEIEMGPFKENLTDEVLSLVLVFEEIVEEEIVKEVEGVVSDEPTDSELISSPTDEQDVINEGNEEVIPEEGVIPEEEEQGEKQIEDIPSDTSDPSKLPDTEEINQSDPLSEDKLLEVVEDTPTVDITQDGVGEIDPTPEE